jgi:hypothetical protein
LSLLDFLNWLKTSMKVKSRMIRCNNVPFLLFTCALVIQIQCLLALLWLSYKLLLVRRNSSPPWCFSFSNQDVKWINHIFI